MCLRSSHLRSNHSAVPKSNNYIKKIVYSIKMPTLSELKLKLIAKNRGIKRYERMSEDKLLNVLNISVKTIKEIKISDL